MKNKTHTFTADELGDAAEAVRVVLTDAMHGRGEGAASLHLLTGSKSEIRRAIAAAIVAGGERGRAGRRQAAPAL